MYPVPSGPDSQALLHINCICSHKNAQRYGYEKGLIPSAAKKPRAWTDPSISQGTLFPHDDFAFASPQLQTCNSYLIFFQIWHVPVGQEGAEGCVPHQGRPVPNRAEDLRRLRVSAGFTALQGALQRHFAELTSRMCSVPIKPPALSRDFMRKALPRGGLAGAGARRPRSAPRPPPGHPRSRTPRGRHGGEKPAAAPGASSAIRKPPPHPATALPRGTPGPSPRPLPSRRADSAVGGNKAPRPLRSSSPHLSPPLRSAAAVSRQPRGDGDGGRTQVPPLGCRPPPLPAGAGSAPAAARLPPPRAPPRPFHRPAAARRRAPGGGTHPPRRAAPPPAAAAEACCVTMPPRSGGAGGAAT